MLFLAIVGSRSFSDYTLLESILNPIVQDEVEVTIVSGGARGADSLAAMYARKHELPLIEFIPDWSAGKHAGFARNGKIVNRADKILIFWDGASKGSEHTLKLALKMGKPTRVIYFTPQA